MRKAFLPQTRVIGATPMRDNLGMHMKDKKGRYLWNMPKPTSFVEHESFIMAPIAVAGKVVRVKKSVPVQVPVYRGVSASLWRYIRGQVKRNQIIAQRKEMENGGSDAAEPAATT